MLVKGAPDHQQLWHWLRKIYRIMHELKWFLGHAWGDLLTMFICDKVTHENHWQIASRVTKKLLFMAWNVLFYFLYVILCPEHKMQLKTNIDRWFRQCCWGWSFLTQHSDVTTVDLWHYANVGYWHCDVLFIIYFVCVNWCKGDLH